jgi:hypothetical protein
MENVPFLSLGAIIGGTSASRVWELAVKRLARRVAEAREGVVSPLAVNVIYQIPGELISPDFEGVRHGRFSRSDRELIIQIALPWEPAGDPDMEVLALLRAAVNVAEDFARQERLTENRLVELRELLARL